MNSKFLFFLAVCIFLFSACSTQKNIPQYPATLGQSEVQNTREEIQVANASEMQEKQPSGEAGNKNENAISVPNAIFQADLIIEKIATQNEIFSEPTNPFTSPVAPVTKPPMVTDSQLKEASVSLGFGIAGVIMSVLGLIPFSIAFSIVALIKAKAAKQIIRENPGLYSNASAADAGEILGIIGLVFSILYLILFIILILSILGLAFNGLFWI